MTDKTSINGEPDTLRGVSPVRRGVRANLSSKEDKAAPSYSTMLLLTREDEKFAEGVHEGESRANEATAIRMLKAGKFAMEEIADYSALSLATVQNLAKTVSVGTM